MSAKPRKPNKSQKAAKPAKSNKAAKPRKPADDREPTFVNKPVPILLFAAALMLFYWGTLYLDTNAGGFSRLVYGPYHSYELVSDVQPGGADDPIKRGADVYKSICSPCHQPNGMGAKGQFPPLAGSDWVNTEGPNRILRIVMKGLNGPLEVNGEPWNAVMPGFGDVIPSDEDLAAVVSFVRNSWGNEASICTPEQAAAVRAEIADRSLPYSASELLALPVETP